MAAINRNIKTGNFIPGSEEYTRPEEISIMGKYLRTGIKDLSESLEISNNSSPGITNKAVIKDINKLPGDETIDEIDNSSGNIQSLSRIKDILREQGKLEELEQKKEYLFRKINNLSLSEEKELIESIKGDDIDPKDSQSYQKYFNKDPKVDKRSLPDPENKNLRFKELDTYLGGVHYGTYSSETLSRSTTPTKDALNASNMGTSSVIFTKPEEINKNILQSLSEDFKELSRNNEGLHLDSEADKIYDSKEIKLSVKKEELEKSNKKVYLNKDIDVISTEDSIKELNNYSDQLVDSSEQLKLSKISEELVKGSSDISLGITTDKIYNSEETKLTDYIEDLNNDKRKVELSKYISKLLDGEIKSLSEQKEALPEGLKEVILIDYLKDTIKNEKELKLAIDNLHRMPGEEKDVILDSFVSELNKDLKKILELNGKYITLGKNEGSKNFLSDLYTSISEIINSEFTESLPGEIKDAALNMGIEKMINPEGTSAEYYRQLSNLYGISTLTAEELKKTLDELVGQNGNWGKKVAAYLSTLLGKYKNFKKYLPTEEVENFKKVVLSTLTENKKYSNFIEDPDRITKEALIKETITLLKKFTYNKIKRVEHILSQKELSDLVNSKSIYSFSVGKQKYGNSITFGNVFKSIKSEIIDETWETIKNWITSVLNDSLFGAGASLLANKVRLPGQDYSHDMSVRNIPNVTGFYDKKTTTTKFSGSPHSTPMEINSTDMNTSGWFTRSLSKIREYSFKDNYLGGSGIQLTLKDLCETDIDSISSVEDLYDTLKKSKKTSAHARTSEGELNGMTLSSNHVWEITIEPYISKFNGYCTWLPFFQELNQLNYNKHHVRTIYDKWIPVTSFELQDKRLVNKTLGLYSGEISYPIAMEYSNELRLTITDDSFKSFRHYFDKVAEVSAYESCINNEAHRSSAEIDAHFAKNRKFDSFTYNNNGYKSTFDSINKNKFAVGMYKNLCFNICIYIMTPQYSTIKKYNLLCVMKDYSIEYTGEVDSSPADVTVSFSIVGETNENYEYDKVRENALFYSSQEILSAQIQNNLLSDIEMSMNKAMDNMHEDILSKQQTSLSVINTDPVDYEMHDSIGGMMGDGNINRMEEYLWNPDGTEIRYQ